MKAFVFDTDEFQRSITRRSFLQRSAYGLGGIALAALCQRTASRAASGTEGENSRWRGLVNPPHAFFKTGALVKGRPSMGSWLLYGLGAETDNLPGFVVFTSAGASGQQPVSARQWSSGFLPSRFQGIQFQSRGNAVHYVGSPEGVCQSTQRQVVEEVNRLNGFLAEERLDPEIQTRISQYEMAFRMQSSVPELTDFRSEPKHVLDLYGVKEPGEGTFASNCLMARRLAERGVRFIQVYHRAWDH